MNIVFFGNGNFGINTIEKLKGSKHKIISIITDTSKKRGRGLKKNTSNLIESAKYLNILKSYLLGHLIYL